MRHIVPPATVVSARQELAMPPKTTLDQADHFGMFMMKAVLDGRATQLIDLAKVKSRSLTASTDLEERTCRRLWPQSKSIQASPLG
jgi:hypothetical protein